MNRQAPEPRPEETPLNYIVRVTTWLATPDRRRLGKKTQAHILDAAKELQR